MYKTLRRLREIWSFKTGTRFGVLGEALGKRKKRFEVSSMKILMLDSKIFFKNEIIIIHVFKNYCHCYHCHCRGALY